MAGRLYRYRADGFRRVASFPYTGEIDSLLAWLSGALFIPSLTLSFGVLTGSGKTFEVVYALWMYMIIQKVPALDFVGVAPESPWYVYALLSPVLFVLAAFARRWQLNSDRVEQA